VPATQAPTAAPGVATLPASVPPSAPSRLARLLDKPLTSYYLVLGATLLLTVLGLVMVLSASSVTAFKAYGESYYFVEKQAIGVVIGLPALWAASRIPARAYRALAYPMLLFSVALLCAVLVPGIGVEVNNNRNWIELGAGFRLQPSEFAKVALIVWGADLLARKRKLLGQTKHVLVPLIPVGCVVAGLVMLGDDLGTAVILGMIVLALLWVAGTPMRTFVALVGTSALVVLFFIHQQEDRLARVYSFGDPFADFHGTGWQGANGIYALATGGFFGVGLGASRQKWGDLPAAHTDFIFAIIGEELGLAGALVVLALFAALGYAGFRIAIRAKDPFVRIAAAGTTAWVLVQAAVNLGAVLGLLPIAGIPLPLVSYGGSALLPTLFALGMLLSFARSEPGVAAALAARGPGRIRRLLRPGTGAKHHGQREAG
jgi:cell division protein FtsW